MIYQEGLAPISALYLVFVIPWRESGFIVKSGYPIDTIERRNTNKFTTVIGDQRDSQR